MICVFALALSIVVMPTNTQAAAKKYAYLTVERLTIGQGLFVQPTKVEIKDGDTVKTVLDQVMKDTKNEYIASTDYGFYMTGMKNADTGKINIPETISKMPQFDYDWGGGYSGTYYPPSNDNNTGNSSAPDLVSYAYNPMSGWMFGINNKSMPSGADKVLVNDQDVIRLHFSVYAYGADVGIASTESAVPNVKLTNKDALIKKVADVKDNAQFMNIAAAKQAYENGIKVLEKYEATDDEVKSAVSAIECYEAQVDLKVAKATIKKIKNIRGKKAKITVKKLTGVTGYQFKYSRYKSLKKATKKTTTATTIKTKKFKKKQTCYAKARAYAELCGIKYYGQWSKRKKVKIKK